MSDARRQRASRSPGDGSSRHSTVKTMPDVEVVSQPGGSRRGKSPDGSRHVQRWMERDAHVEPETRRSDCTTGAADRAERMTHDTGHPTTPEPPLCVPHPASRIPSLHVIGDIHGQLVGLMSLLLDAGIVDDDLYWSAEDAQVWFVGDFADRGPDGIGTIDLVMRLEDGAAQAGGKVGALLGNHDLLLLMANRFGDRVVSDVTGLTFLGEWLAGGGRRADLAGMTTERAAWLARRPAMALVADMLLVHSDSLWYLEYGTSVTEVNATVHAILAGDDLIEWDRLLGAMSTRFAFDERHSGNAGAARALLATFGGSRIVHGHTPIALMTNRPPAEVDEPLVYAGGAAVNVDGGLYLGGSGVILTVPGNARSDIAGQA